MHFSKHMYRFVSPLIVVVKMLHVCVAQFQVFLQQLSLKVMQTACLAALTNAIAEASFDFNIQLVN